MEELADGGIAYGELVIIPGVELESREDKGGQGRLSGLFPLSAEPEGIQPGDEGLYNQH